MLARSASASTGTSFLADRDQEQGVEERESEPARHRLAEAGDRPRPAASGRRPSWRASATPPASPSSQAPAPAATSSSPGAQAAGASCRSSRPPLPDQPADQGQDQQAMVEGRAVPPDRDHVGRVAVEEEEDRRRRRRRGRRDACASPVDAGRARLLDRRGSRSCRRPPARRGRPSRRAARAARPSDRPAPSCRRAARADRRGARRGRRAGRRSPRPAPRHSSATSRSRPGSASIPSKAAGEATTGRAIAIASSTLFWMPRAMLQRRDDDVGGGEPGAHVGDRAGDDHALAGELRAPPAAGLAADDREARVRARCGSTSSREPASTASTLGA